ASFVSSRIPVPRDTLVATALELLAAGFVLFAAGLLTGEASDLRPERVSVESLACLVYLIVAGSLVAYTAYVWLLANAPSPRPPPTPTSTRWSPSPSAGSSS